MKTITNENNNKDKWTKKIPSHKKVTKIYLGKDEYGNPSIFFLDKRGEPLKTIRL